MKKRILSLALAICMLMSAVPVSHAGILSAGNADIAPVEPVADEILSSDGILSSSDESPFQWESLPEQELSQGILSSGEDEQLESEPSHGILSSGNDEEIVEEPEFGAEEQPGPGLLVVQCGECGYLDNNHAEDCSVIASAKPVITVPVVTDEERKPAIVYSNTYFDTYAELMTAETLEDFESTLDSLSDDQQEELFDLLSDDEQDALDELEDTLTRQAIAEEPQKVATRAPVTVESRSVALSAARRAALQQLGYELIVNVFGKIVETVEMLQSTYTTLETVTPTEDADYQWQILADDAWVDILDQTEPQIRVSYAMVASLLDRHDAVSLRCEIMDGDDVSYTDPVEVCVELGADDVIIDAEVEEEPVQEETEEADGEPLALFTMPEAFEEESEDAPFMLLAEEGGVELKKFNIIIEYKYENGDIAAATYIAEVIEGNAFKEKVKSPSVQGYLPYIGTESAHTVLLDYTNISADDIITVTYKPTNVEYTVIYYQQDVLTNKYVEKERKTFEGLTGSVVGLGINEGELNKEYKGFYQLPYTKPKIAADGSTVVEIYYDRYYYLLSFALDGGYGAEPVYARYGSSINNVTAPTKAGYDFAGWTYDGEIVSLPDTIPAENRRYTAAWTPSVAGTSYTVVYWLQNADPETNADGTVKKDGDEPVYKYSYWTSHTVTGVTAETVVRSADFDLNDLTAEEYAALDKLEIRYSKKSDAADKNNDEKAVSGDGSTVINVYYDRNTYTLKFYYAMSSGTKYYVVGGTTYHFGGMNSTEESIRDDEIKLLDQYNTSTASSQRGEVDELPTLNSIGSQRGYKQASDYSQVNGTDYQYHYLSFSAKYGADLTNLWPCNVFNSVTRTEKNSANNWSGQEAFVSAWNGEYYVYYSRHNANQTIKGNYNELDYQLLWDPRYGDSDTIAYLCFWENGANIDWSVPELYRYNIYVPVLEGQDLPGNAITKVWNGVTYYKKVSYDTVDDSDYTKQTAPAMRGFTYLTYRYTSFTSSLTDEQKKLYREAYDMDFYYSRDQYDLTLWNVNSPAKEDKNIPYETNISAYKDFTPSLPSGFESGSRFFDGWYTSPQCAEGTEFVFGTDTVMPAGDVMLYAKWTPTVHTVRFYRNEKDYLDGNMMDKASFQVSHDLTVTDGRTEEELIAIENVQNGDAKLIAWFYRDDNGNERAFDINNMPVKQDLDLYAKWDSGAFMDYIIYYQLESNGESVNDPEILAVADKFNGFAHVGDTITFEAKGGTDLYPEYQVEYFPKIRSHSITIAEDETTGEWYPTGPNGEKEQSYTFYYVHKESVPYKVEYIDKASGEPMPEVPASIVENNKYAVVNETFKMIPGYVPDAYQKALVVVAEGEDKDNDGVIDSNVIRFYYTKDATRAYYKVSHYIEVSGGKWEEYTSSTALSNISAEVTASPIEIPGFTFDPSKEGTLMAGSVTAEGLHLKLYYTRNRYPYKVMYVDKYSGEELAFAKIAKAPYEAVVSESPIPISDYAPVSTAAKTLVIRMETEAALALNVIRFEYERIPTELKVEKIWNCAACYKQDAVFIIKGGELGTNGLRFVIPFDDDDRNDITITGLKAGLTYIVEEEGGWSWRFTVEDAKTIQLKAAGNVLDFTNTLNNDKIYWFDGSDWKRNRFGDPEETNE